MSKGKMSGLKVTLFAPSPLTRPGLGTVLSCGDVIIDPYRQISHDDSLLSFNFSSYLDTLLLDGLPRSRLFNNSVDATYVQVPDEQYWNKDDWYCQYYRYYNLPFYLINPPFQCFCLLFRMVAA